MLLRSEAMRKSVFLAIWNSTLAARILLRSSFISLTFKPWVCTNMAITLRPSLSVNSSIFSAFACVGMYFSPPFRVGWPLHKNGLRLVTEGRSKFSYHFTGIIQDIHDHNYK